MNKGIIIFIICIFLILPIFSLSAKITQVTENPLTALDIVNPKFDYYKFGENIELNFQVYNSSGFLLDNTTVSCEFHLYHENGYHVLNQTLNYHYDEFYVTLNNSILDNERQYTYIMWCENSEGGFISSNFIVNQSGSETVNNFFPTILVFLILIGVYFFFGDLHQKKIAMDSTKVSTWITILCYAMIIIKTITLSYFTYAYYMNLDISALLGFVWFSDLFILSGICLFTMLFAMLGYFNPDIKNGKWEPKKW